MTEPIAGRGATKRRTTRGGGGEEALALAVAAMKKQDAFEAERMASRALRDAHARRDYTALARALPTLREARLSIRDAALQAKKIFRVDALDESTTPEAGLWLVEPPAVGMDGRNLRERARAAGVATLVVVREPQTRSGHWPVVMVGPATVRARIEPVKGDPTPAWILGALDALGAAAVDSVDASAPETRVNQLVDRLDTMPECEAVYTALAEACAVAQTSKDNADSRRRVKPAHDDDANDPGGEDDDA